MGWTKTYKLDKDYFLEKNDKGKYVIRLSKEYIAKKWHIFKKLTGSRFSTVISDDPNNSSFQVWCDMVKLFTSKAKSLVLDAGHVIEPKIRELAAKKLGYSFKDYNPEDIGWDAFKVIDPILGGIPDGEPINDDGEIDYSSNKRMLEIKTTSIDSLAYGYEKGELVLKLDGDKPKVKEIDTNKEKWFVNGKFSLDNHQNYIDQLSLYLYLRNQTKGVFAVCFLKTQDYAKPEEVDIKDRDIYYLDLNINLKEFEKKVEKARKWYKEHIVKGISPELTDVDMKWLKEVGAVR